MATRTKAAPPAVTPPPVLRIVTLEEILATHDLGEKLVPMPEWGRDAAVRIKGLSMNDLVEIRKANTAAGITDPDDRITASNKGVVLRGVVEPALTLAAVDALWEKSSDAILRLVTEINRLNGATPEVREKLEAEFPAERAG